MLCCCLIGLGLVLSSLFGSSSPDSEFQKHQVDAFVALVDAQAPHVLRTDADRSALRRQLLDLGNGLRQRPRPTDFIPFTGLSERKLLDRANDLAERAARARRADDGATYLRTIGEFYAELGAYFGDPTGRALLSRFATSVHPVLPPFLLGGALFMHAQPELCGVESGAALEGVLTGLGFASVASNGVVSLTKAGKRWLATVGTFEREQTRVAALVEPQFWTRLSELSGASIHPLDLWGPAWRPTCDLALSSSPAPAVTATCAHGGCH